MLLSCLIQTVTIRRARVTSLDAVRFARAAEAIDRVGAIDALRGEQQPLFPVWVWGVHQGLLHTVGPTDSHWAMSVQLAAAIPLVLAILPIYFLILRLGNRSAAIAGSLFFCVLPEIARLGADGLSDSLHLLFFCLAFWAMVEILASQTIGRREVKWSALAGIAAGLAVLTRVEVLVLVAAFLPVWAIGMVRPPILTLPRRKHCPKDAFTGDMNLDETGEMPAVASTDVELDLDDLTAALQVSESGDTVEQPRDDATVEQPRPSHD